TDIVQLVGQYLTLRKSGHDSLTGLCPFHQEKTGSFSVSPAKQVFYCFGCGKGGDAITFLRELEHLSYVEAIERLASTAGVTLRYEGDSATERRAAERRKALYRANEQAAALFSTMLTSGKEATDARAYVTERGIGPESIEALYTMHLARQAVAETGDVFVVEGYTDVIGLAQAGITNVVATCGTALGERHFEQLARFATRAILSFDSDEAGARAAERAFAY